MRLAEDERARVPFALIGVLLLLGAVAAATVQLDRRQVNRNAALAGDRAEAAAETTLRDSVRDAGARAAANPVVSPAGNPYGETLDPDRPYRSYVELLVAIELRERLVGTPQRVGNATAVVDLRPIDDPQSASRAIERTSVSAAGRGLVRVRVESVPISIRRNGHEVARRHTTLSANVTTPALTLHERTTTFESRLDGETLEPGTLNRALTGSLYAFAWTRGYAQYAGIPFENVLTNEHAELITNLGVLDVQRSVFGHADVQGEQRLADRTAAVLADEGIGMGTRALEGAGLPVNTTAVRAATVSSPEPRTRTIGVNVTADRALADVVEADTQDVDAVSGDGWGRPLWSYSYRTLVERASSVETRLATARNRHDPRIVDPATSPAGEWRRDRVVSRGEPTVVRVTAGDAPAPAIDGRWTRNRTVERTVVVQRNDSVRFRNESSGASTTIDRTVRREIDVAIALDHRPLQRDWIPSVGVQRDVSDGRYPALLDRAATRLLAEQGGPDGLAGSIATNASILTTATVAPATVDGIADDAYADVADLRDEIRGISTTTTSTHILTDANPIDRLASTIEQRSDRYRAVPTAYDGLDHRAAVALRGIYLDRVRARLDERARGADATRRDVDDAVRNQAALPDAGLADFLAAGMEYSRPEPSEIETRAPVPSLDLTVDAGPSYLSLAEATDTLVDPPTEPYHPLGVRTSTIAGLPTEELAEQLTDAIASVFGGDEQRRVPLSVAARAIQSANDVDSSQLSNVHGTHPQEFQGDRARLISNVEEELTELEPILAADLAGQTALDHSTAEDVVNDSFQRYGGTGGTALAVTSGALTATVADTAARRSQAVDSTDADRAETVMRDTVEAYRAETDSGIPVDQVRPVSQPTREVIRHSVQSVVDEAASRGQELARNEILERTGFSVLPSRGFPLAPVPGWWRVTANIWHVDVYGAYSSFAVRAQQGGPSGGSHVSYVRYGQRVLVDVNGDGRPEPLGTAERIDFHASSTVVVVVPRGGGGVGNNGTGFRSTSEGFDALRDRGTGDDCVIAVSSSIPVSQPSRCRASG